MKCKQCKRHAIGKFCDKACHDFFISEKLSLQNQAFYKLRGKDFFKRKHQKISAKDLQDIWPKS